MKSEMEDGKWSVALSPAIGVRQAQGRRVMSLVLSLVEGSPRMLERRSLTAVERAIGLSFRSVSSGRNTAITYRADSLFVEWTLAVESEPVSSYFEARKLNPSCSACLYPSTEDKESSIGEAGGLEAGGCGVGPVCIGWEGGKLVGGEGSGEEGTSMQ